MPSTIMVRGLAERGCADAVDGLNHMARAGSQREGPRGPGWGGAAAKKEKEKNTKGLGTRCFVLAVLTREAYTRGGEQSRSSVTRGEEE